MEQIKGEIPFVRILIPLLSGISTAYLLLPSLFFASVSVYSTLTVFLLLTCLIVFYKQYYNYHNRWLVGLVFNAAVFFSGYVLTDYKSQRLDRNHFSRSEYEVLLVSIQSEPRLSDGIWRFNAEVEQGFRKNNFYSLRGNLLITLKADSIRDYRYGDLLMIPSVYSEVAGPMNPEEFDYKAYLSNRQIYYQTFINASQSRLLKRGQGSPLISNSLQFRRRLVMKFAKYVSDKDAASVASTLILGYRTDLSREVLDAYSKTGTMHVLSVSGMHVGIVFIVMVFLLQFMERGKKLRLIRAFIMIMLIWFYAIITGFSPSVCRSAMMISFVIIGKAIRRSQNTYNLLAISAVLLLVYDPFFLFDVGFQLSYLSVLGLIYFYPKLYGLLYIKNWLADKIWSYIALSTAAQLATFPLSMYYFHQFPVYFLVSNIFIILPVAFIMYAGLLFLFIPWDILLQPLGRVLNKSIIFMDQGLFYIEHFPYSNIGGIWIDTLDYLMIYGFILSMVFAFLYRNKALVYSSLLILFILTLKGSFAKIDQYDQSQVVFYSLRKNSGIGLFEKATAFLITDLNKADKTYEYAIKPSIESNGIRSMKIIRPGTLFSEENLFYDGNFIQFRNFRILIWNKTFDKKVFPGQVSVDILLLQDNPQVTVKSLLQSVRFKTLLIDASNMDYRIKDWQKEASDNGIHCYVLKGNPAYVIKM